MRKNLTSEQLDDQLKEDWRELGFFYDYDKELQRWRLIGSRSGLLKFGEILNDYVADERNAALSEHEHYGPYWYLKIVTWSEPLITADDIRGTLDDLRRLSELTKQKLENAQIGDEIEIDEEYAPKNEAKLVFTMKPDDFDPASADPDLNEPVPSSKTDS